MTIITPINPVVDSSFRAYNALDIVRVDDSRVRAAASHIYNKMLSEAYTPRIWRTHELHLLPPDPFNASDPKTRDCLNWIFVISSLNFSFWSDKEESECYGVEWRESWTSNEQTVWTGYWSLVAAINRALEEGIPITDPAFYSSKTRCPDSVIAHVFRPAARSSETIPLLEERIAILRQNGKILCKDHGGCFFTFIKELQKKKSHRSSALDLVCQVTKTFPSFRDQVDYQGHEVIIWKRAQILVAEIWAAFYPACPTDLHPIFPGGGIHQLTMFADYRVPQVLHHLQILHYPQSLIDTLESKQLLAHGSPEEISIRVASILAVEKVRDEITSIQQSEGNSCQPEIGQVNSVLIDFYLWDLAKRIESGEEVIEGIQVNKVVPSHRTRSIWY